MTRRGLFVLALLAAAVAWFALRDAGSPSRSGGPSPASAPESRSSIASPALPAPAPEPARAREPSEEMRERRGPRVVPASREAASAHAATGDLLIVRVRIDGEPRLQTEWRLLLRGARDWHTLAASADPARGELRAAATMPDAGRALRVRLEAPGYQPAEGETADGALTLTLAAAGAVEAHVTLPPASVSLPRSRALAGCPARGRSPRTGRGRARG
jgi:hypothetical protein